MPEFFQTLMGKKFYDSDVPRLIRALERIATALESSRTNKTLATEPEYKNYSPVAEAISIAQQRYAGDDYEISDNANVDMIMEDDGTITGAWVAARVFVSFETNIDAPPQVKSQRPNTLVVCSSCYKDITIPPKQFDPANPMCQDCLDYIAYKEQESQES